MEVKIIYNSKVLFEWEEPHDNIPIPVKEDRVFISGEMYVVHQRVFDYQEDEIRIYIC